MQIFVKTLTGKTLTFDVEEDTTADDLAQMIADREGLPVDHQRLIFKGMQFKLAHQIVEGSEEQLKPLKDYGVERESTLHLILRLC
jgi:large subunit ribosomal protein L40e